MKSLLVYTTILSLTFFPLLLRAQQEQEQEEEGMGDASLLEHNDEAPPDAVAVPTSTPDPNDEQIAELNDRIDLLEDDIERILGEQDRLQQQSTFNRIFWLGSYQFGINVFRLQDNTKSTEISHLTLQVDENGEPLIDPETGSMVPPIPEENSVEKNTDKWLDPVWVNRFRLGMANDFTESLRFYAQLSVFKYFNEIRNTEGTLDLNSNAYPRDTAVRIERIYIDWFAKDWVAFSVGRISSSDGPPAELKENGERRSGWGVQMVEAVTENFMVTFYMKKFLEGAYLRLFYAPFGNHQQFVLSEESSLFDDFGIDPLHSWGGVFEVKLPHLGDNMVQLGFVHVPKFTPGEIPLTVPGNDEPIYPSSISNNDLGTYLNANTLLLLKDIGGTGLDLFGAYALTLLQPKKGRIIYDIPYSIYHPVVGDTGQVVEVPYEIGLASYEEGNGTTNLGHMVYAGFRFTLPTSVSERYPTRFGGEFNWGTKYHVAWSSPSDQLVNKLANKGWCWEAYFIQQLIPDYLFLRLARPDK
jgi:hypothetical protein